METVVYFALAALGGYIVIGTVVNVFRDKNSAGAVCPSADALDQRKQERALREDERKKIFQRLFDIQKSIYVAIDEGPHYGGVYGGNSTSSEFNTK